MTTNDIKTLVAELNDALVRKARNNGQEFVSLKEDSPKWMTEVVRTVHGGKLPDDTVYEFISRCADAIAENEDPNDAIAELEPDIYTNDLTAWLHARVDHVEYLSEVLAESVPGDGFSLLQMAQQKQIQEVGYALISALEDVDVEVQS